MVPSTTIGEILMIFRKPNRHRTNLSNVIKGVKIAATNYCKTCNRNNFKWQRSYYDRIIRNEKELFNIRKYIQQNPLKWSLEKGIINLNIEIK
jgi:REP-associated tyrosine transposase